MSARSKVAAAIALTALLLGGCTPTKVLKSGPHYDAAVRMAEDFCAAAATPDPADERALFSERLAKRFDAVDPAEREAAGILTSSDARPLCRPGRVQSFGPPPDHVIGVRVRIALASGTDTLFLDNAYRRLRLDDVSYARPRRIGNETAHSLDSALYILALQADLRKRREGAAAGP